MLNIRIKSQEDPIRYYFEQISDNKYKYSAITLNYDIIIEEKVNFLGESDRKIPLNIDPRNSNIWEHFSYAKLHGSVDSEIIPPNWNKSIQKKKIKNAWELAYKLLQEANQIRFIGYSLPITDSYVKYLVKAALTDFPHLTHLRKIDVICYDPKGDVENRYREFIKLNNFRFLSQKFEVILTLINDKLKRYHQSSPNLYSWVKFEKYYEEIMSELSK